MVSNIGDQFGQTFPQKWPQFWPLPQQETHIHTGISQADFDALKKEVEELKKLLLAASAFDKATGQPHCEMEEKVKLIKAIAKLVGVDLGDAFGDSAKPA